GESLRRTIAAYTRPKQPVTTDQLTKRSRPLSQSCILIDPSLLADEPASSKAQRASSGSMTAVLRDRAVHMSQGDSATIISPVNRPGVFIHPTAEVADSAAIGPGTKIWHQAQVRENATIGHE